MKLRLKCSGGLANVQIEDVLDTSELPPALARRAEALLCAEKLERVSISENLQRTDVIQYDLTVLPAGESEESRHYCFSEASTDSELLDLLGELMHQIIRRQAAIARQI